MPERQIDLDEIVESAKLWRYDNPSDYLVKALKGLSGPAIMLLHEELTARATAGTLRTEINEFAIPVHYAWEPIPESPAALPPYYRLLNNWLLGLSAHAVMMRKAPERVEPLDDVATADKDTLGSYWGRTQTIWFDGNVGQLFLDEDFPRAYESVTDQAWPRYIRAKGQHYRGVVLEYMNPRSLGLPRVPEQVRRYWDAVDAAVRSINDSDDWWAWLRGGPWRRIELNVEKAAQAGNTEGKPNSHRIQGTRHTNLGHVLKIRINLAESVVRRLDGSTINELARADLHSLLASCSKKYAYSGPAPQLPPA